MKNSYSMNEYQEQRSSLEIRQQKELEEKFTIVHPKIKCSCNSEMSFICSNPTCIHYAIFCSNVECPSSLQHQKCERSKLRDITLLMQSRSKELKQFMERFFKAQNRLIDSAISRRQRYMEEVYLSGLEPRHMNILQTIYFNKKTTTEVQGCYADDLEEQLRSSNQFVTQALKHDHIYPYQQELDRMNEEMQTLERIIFDNLIENRKMRELQISKYGYYDITSAMMNLSHNERRAVGQLTISNTCIKPDIQAYIVKVVQSKQVPIEAVNKRVITAYLKERLRCLSTQLSKIDRKNADKRRLKQNNWIPRAKWTSLSEKCPSSTTWRP